MPDSENTLGRLAVSFVIDDDPVFAYTGWHLAHSIVKHVDLPWEAIHVQFTPEVSTGTVEEFSALGCTVHRLKRFGDGKYCNKLSQWENLRDVTADHFVFLDTDMICIGDFTAFLQSDVIGGKVVDLPNPSLELLETLFDRAGIVGRPKTVPVEARDGQTFLGNCNGGLYSVPKQFAEELFECWRTLAEMLLGDIAPLKSAGKDSHVDQISFCMALHETGLPFEQLASNANYYLHFHGEHRSKDPARPIALLHYHNSSIGVLGLLEPAGATQPYEIAAVNSANAQIRANFNNRMFWDLRYRHFPERGSGVGSRGANLTYKRALLQDQGAEVAESVLDVGCGDLEVVGALDLKNYVGIDQSSASLARAAAVRPDWKFLLLPAEGAAPAELVLCFEVAIHQETTDQYLRLIEFVTARTIKTLIISGYDALTGEIAANHMLFFHEPLVQSLEQSGKFRSIQRIGAHSDVVVYRCDV